MTSPFRFLAALAVVLLPFFAGSASAADTIGIILMHGKAGSPDHVRSLADDLTVAGYRVVTPDMPWSRARGYDRTLVDAHREVDALVADLRRQGAGRIVLAGHSMGANMAMGYAATHAGVDAVMAIGPGQTVEAARFRDELGSSVKVAEAMIGGGRGGETATFTDLHLGKLNTVKTTAEIYHSYFDPDGLANMPATATVIDVPFLWIVGSRDKNMMDRGRAYAFDLAPSNPFNRYVEVAADHMGTPDASRTAIREWLGRVFGAR